MIQLNKFFYSFIELSTNERTDFKARELKSIHVDADGWFLKLVIHKNHSNSFNTHNQVCQLLLEIKFYLE